MAVIPPTQWRSEKKRSKSKDRDSRWGVRAVGGSVHGGGYRCRNLPKVAPEINISHTPKYSASLQRTTYMKYIIYQQL